MDQPLGVQISRLLADRGVEVIFGIPGMHNQEMYRGIAEAGLRHVLARHEQGAGFMADGYARASRKPGVAYVITGPGICNILTPLGQAYSDSVPLLVISSCLDETAAMRGQLHQMRDQRGAAATVCAASDEARDATSAYRLIDRALMAFKTGRPRPRHIQVPIAQLEGANQPCTAPQPRRSDHARPRLEQVAQVLDLLVRARRPIVIFGGGVVNGELHRSEIWLEKVRHIPRRARALSFTTYAGRGTIATDDPLHMGSLLARPQSAELFARADLVMAVGTELSEVDLWRTELGHHCTMIRVDLDAEVLTDHHGAAITFRNDSAAFLEPLADLLREKPAFDSDWDATDCAALRDAWRADLDAERPGILPVCDALRAVLPDETMIFSDMTQFAYAALEIWPMPRPGHWHHPSGFGTLGYALPAAIGGAVARPGLPTVAIAGDYGFQFTLQELGTAVELGQPLPILLWDNGKLGEIEAGMIRAQIAPNAVVARNPDFCALARAYGAAATRPLGLTALQDALATALDHSGPTLIHMTPDTLAG